MLNRLKIAAAAVLLVVAVGGYQVMQVRAANTPEALEVARLNDVSRADAEAMQAHVAVLAKGGCQVQAMAMLDQHAKTPITALADLPKRLGDDMVLCLSRGIMSAYLEDNLKDAGLLTILRPAG
jgi:hypothetical protein